MSHVLVLANDLSPDGTALGPGTIARLYQGVMEAKRRKTRLLVVAGWSPRHPEQPAPMARMMLVWCQMMGFMDVDEGEAQIFNTRGELTVAFRDYEDVVAIVSDPLHLERVKIIVTRMHGKSFAESLQYIPTNEPAMTARGKRLEPLKRAFVRYCPFLLQDMVMVVLHRTPLRRINLSD